MLLICEEMPDKYEVITEAKADGKKNYFITGVFMQSETKNRNNRIYPSHILEREATRYIRDYVNEKRALGELGHPNGPSINLDRASHIIEELRRDGNNYVGKAKILETPYGNIVRNFIDEGIKLGVSSRGVGTLKARRDGIQQVQDDYYLATAADIVADPSAPHAFVHGIMEGKQFVWENGIFKEIELENARTLINNTSKNDLEEQFVKVFKHFISKL
jgi:hypothetical protein